MTKLTEKQEKYCVNRAIEEMNQTDAYKNAYDTSNMKDETIYSEACKLDKDQKITTRIEELRKEARSDKVINTIQKKELLTQWIYDDDNSKSDRLKAMDILNKMDGDYITKVEGSINLSYEESLREVADIDEY